MARVKKTLRERGLAETGATILVACSGGPDSAALLHVLAAIGPGRGWVLHAASVNHGLRPGAGRDVELAGRQAAELGIPFRGLRTEVPPGASLQAQARASRYRCLAAEGQRVGARWIAVGHTRDDQAETVLARLLRGSGLRGLSGVLPERPDGVIRPLIDCRREDVHRYVRRHGMEFCEDPSNDDAQFERVRLRRLLPLLTVESNRLVDHLADLADECRETAAWIDRSVAELGLGDARDLEAAQLEGLAPPVRKAALAAWVRALTGAPARRAHVESLESALHRGRGEVLIGAGWRISCGARWVAQHDLLHPSRSRGPAE